MTVLRRDLARLALGTAAFAAPRGAVAQGAAARPFVHAIPADISSLDPADSRSQQDQEIGVNIYERLVQMRFEENADGTLRAHATDVVPQLAESWTVEGPVITFKLRPGIKFHGTGNPLTSEDVRYSFSRLVGIVGNGRNQAGIAGIFKAEQIEALDPLTVRITFTDNRGTPTAIPVALTSMKFFQFAHRRFRRGKEARDHRRSLRQPVADAQCRDDGTLLRRQPHLGPAARTARRAEPLVRRASRPSSTSSCACAGPPTSSP